MKKISFIGRVAAIKGVDNLLKAFSSYKCHETAAISDWQLVITGPDQEGHTADLKNLARELNIEDRVVFTGPKFREELQAAYAETDIFVLPSHSENFGSVVIEALAHEIPVITTKGTPWRELVDRGCGWWVDVGVVPLENALFEAMSLTDDERHEMGKRGRKLVEEKYTWGVVVNKMLNEYENVVKGV